MQNKRRLFSTIRARMVGTYLLVTVAALVVITIAVATLLESFLVSQRTQEQLESTTRLAQEVAPEYEAGDASTLYSILSERALGLGGRVLVLDSDAVVQADSASLLNGYYLPYREVRDVLVDGNTSSYGFHRITRTIESSGLLALGDETDWAVYYTSPITVNGLYTGCLLFSSSIQDVENSVRNVLNQIILIFVAVTVAICAVSLIMSGLLTKPIVELTAAIRSIGRQGYGVKVDVKGNSEMAELGAAFNRMSEQIETHDRVRDEFIANASHELKTPLATMKLLSESILYDENASPEVMRDFFSDVNHEMSRLSRIVTDLLSLVQDDATDAEPTMTTVEFSAMVMRVVKRLSPLADAKGITLTVDTAPVNIRADELRMEQAVVNLVENAIKYTDRGSVSVILCVEENSAVLSVSDTGIGIPKEALEHVFERFYRVDKARSRGTGGTGLGLAIVEKTILLHGGSIDVESKPGEGTTFIVRLPIDAADGEAEE